MSLISWLMIVGLVVCNIILIKQNLHLREVVEKQEIEKRVQIGQSFDEFKAVDNINNSVNLLSAKPTKKVILFSSTSCPFCKKQNPYWTQLASQINSEKYEIFMLFNDREECPKVEEYLRSNGYTSIDNSIKPLYSSGETLQKYRLNGNPATLIIDENGVVEKSWSGLWDKPTIKEVENYFHAAIN
jgi:peroxiredoxin